MILKSGEGYYVPKFIYDGKEPPTKLKSKIGSALIAAHNEWASYTRPYYPGWNAAYDGPMDHLDENDRMLDSSKSQYIRYLQNCITEVMPLFNKKMATKNKYFKKYVVGDELELIGIMKNGCKVSFLMKEVPLEDLLKYHRES